MSFKTMNAILRGRWLIDKSYAQASLPLVFRMMSGERVAFDDDDDDDDDHTMPKPLISNVASVYSVGHYTDLSRIPVDSIAVVNINGPLMKYGDMCSWGMVDHANIINNVANAGNIKGIIVDIDSPGGTVDGTAMLADTIVRAKQRKPVVTMVDDGMAASAGYWIFSAGTEAYLTQEHDMVGSVGVYTTLADWKAHYQEYWKLPVKDVYAPQSTDKNKSYFDALAGDETELKAELKVIADQFIKTVKRNRSGKLSTDEWTSGKMFYAKDAKRIGLIDGVKTFEQIVKRVQELAA